MTYEEALIVSRHGRTFGIFDTPARKKLRDEAIDLSKARAEELMLRADRNAPKLTVLDVQIYENVPHDPDRMWMKHVLSNGTCTKEFVTRSCAGYVKAAFEAGKKAGANEAAINAFV